ncbi:uncharacterized protein [Haliotis cracherodii]|uniref:uncharacterized protein n=1 Tax=Haliotis cracherodii TaxID=6455 RepID=UPI0039E7A8B5
MDRALGKNLESLAEEDDEEEEEEATGRSEGAESEVDSDSESDSEDEDGDPGAIRGEPNKFEGLCDGVLNSTALVQVSLLELLELKDELLGHALPPTLLVKLALTTAKVFRSISDMNMPMNELVRLVRVYSTPWEEKSAALKKLHEDYESKQRQLNIAIKRLQLVDAHSKRIAKEKRIMNWEKLFSKVTSTKGHGRRWKFLIETIKQKAKMGLEHVQEYTKALEQASDSEDGEEEVVDTTKATESSPEAIDVVSEKTEDTTESRGEKEDEEGEEEEEESEAESEDPEEGAVPTVTINLTQESEDEESSDQLSRSTSPKKVRFGETVPPPVVKPQMRDMSIDTGEPEYDLYLHVRMFAPEDLNHQGLKCSVTYGDQMYKTGVLDVEEDKEPEQAAEMAKSEKRPPAASGGRTSPGSKAAVEEDGSTNKKYEEFMVRLPDEVPRGVLITDKAKSDTPNNVQIAVHHGQFEEMIAMATLDLEDLKELDLRTVYHPPPKGDDDVPRSSAGRDDDLLSLSDSIDLSFGDDESEHGTPKPREDPVKDVDPLPFPLYSLQVSGRSDAVHMPVGNQPLILYWGRKRRPPVFNRQTGTLGINEVVFELTGIDLNTTTKEDLHKDMRDQALSAIEFTPEPQEETIALTEVEELQKKHTKEMTGMKDSYEKQLKALLENISHLEEERKLLQEQQQNMRPLSARSRTSTSPPRSMSRGASTRRTPAHSPDKDLAESEKVSLTIPVSPGTKYRPAPPATHKPRKNFRVGRPLPKWGEALPQDFLERLRLYEEESKQHMAELNERTLRDIRDNLEKKLAGQHRLSKREEAMYDALKDVSLPALFMPFRSGTVFNPRAHQYFHPTGSTDLRLTQPPSMFQLPPLTKHNQKLSVVNLFELSSNFSSRSPSWFVERYIQQQRPASNEAFNPSATTSNKAAPNYLTQDSQLSDSGLDAPPHTPQGNPSMPEQEVGS